MGVRPPVGVALPRKTDSDDKTKGASVDGGTVTVEANAPTNGLTREAVSDDVDLGTKESVLMDATESGEDRDVISAMDGNAEALEARADLPVTPARSGDAGAAKIGAMVEDSVVVPVLVDAPNMGVGRVLTIDGKSGSMGFAPGDDGPVATLTAELSTMGCPGRGTGAVKMDSI